MHHYIKSKIRRQYFMRQACDYLQYTFTPPFAFVLLTGSYGALTIMAIMFYRFDPLAASLIFCGCTGVLFVAMVVSFIGWRKYRRFYNSVLNK